MEQAEIARAKAALSSTLRRRLREVSKLQTDIGKIQKHQELVGMAWGQKVSEHVCGGGRMEKGIVVVMVVGYAPGRVDGGGGWLCSSEG